MIPRIALLFAITGAGHIFSIAVLRYIAQRGDASQIAGIGEIDSIIQLMIGLIGFGMQSDAIRNIALYENWEEKYRQAQEARNTLSILLMVLAVIAFKEKSYLCFLMAPLFGASSDYALYARGFSVIASTMAFVRVVAPLLAALVAVYFGFPFVIESYISITLVIYIITNMVMSNKLGAPAFFKPRLVSLNSYIRTIPLGVISLCYYFFGLGLLIFCQWFYNDSELAILFLVLKLYLIYKGAIRVIHQAFVSRMSDDDVCLSIDRISILLGITFLGSVLIFPTSFITLFFGHQFVNNSMFFIYAGISALVYSIFNSSATSLLLKKRDMELMYLAVVSVIITVIFLVVIQKFSRTTEMITLSLLMGESFLAISLAITFYSREDVWRRLSFLFISSIGLLVPVIVKWIFSESLTSYILSFATMGILFMALSYNKFILPVKTNS